MNDSQECGLFDLVPTVSRLSNTYFVPTVIVDSAMKNSESYLDYAVTLFDNYINPDVARLCTWGDYSNDNIADGNVRASLPLEAMSVFLGKFPSFHLYGF